MLGHVLKKKRACRSKPKISYTFKQISPHHLELNLPIITVSEANSSEHWAVKAKRHKQQKQLVRKVLLPFKSNITLPCFICIKRLAPRKLDATDNLPTSQKYIIDAVCETITGITQAGRADDHPEIKIKIDQQTSKEYGVNIQIAWGSAGPFAPFTSSCVADEKQINAEIKT